MQKGGFAASGRAHYGDEFTWLDLKRDAAKGRNLNFANFV
jgi:hypothetical protein